jgi:ketosteroid isomerase-like protein
VSSSAAETIARCFVEAFSANDLDTLRQLLTEDVVSYVTNADGGVDEVHGRESYVARIAAMDVPSARLRLDVTQAVAISPDQVLVMVEVTAARGERTLHNHAAHLLRVRDGKIAQMWMVEALPAYSAEFWS